MGAVRPASGSAPPPAPPRSRLPQEAVGIMLLPGGRPRGSGATASWKWRTSPGAAVESALRRQQRWGAFMQYRVGPKVVTCVLPVAVLLLAAGGVWAQETPGFRHETHRSVECTACHESEQGEAVDFSLRDCRSCHHGDPANTVCERCHAPADARTVARQMPRTLDIRLGSLDGPRRSLPFRHSSHAGLRCQSCHTQGLGLSAAEVRCTGCHEAHHTPTVKCLECHETPAPEAHDKQVHLGCGDAGCHERAPQEIQRVPKTRELCLVCHDGMAYHKPGQACASCHLLPPPSGTHD